MESVQPKIEDMTPIEMAYLTKGVENLTKLMSEENRELQKGVSEALTQRCLRIQDGNLHRFDPYSMSKLMRYLSKDKLGEDQLTIFAGFTKQLVQTLSERQISLVDADLDDPLIDVEMHDIVDIVRVLGALVKADTDQSKKDEYIPKLFDTEEAQMQSDYKFKEDSYIELYQPKINENIEGHVIKDIGELSKYALEMLRDPIQKKLQKEDNAASQLQISSVADIMHSYGAIAQIYSKRQFFYDLESVCADKIMLKDRFTTINSTKFLWGQSRFHNRNINPYFNADPASCILSRDSIVKVPEIFHKMPKLFA